MLHSPRKLPKRRSEETVRKIIRKLYDGSTKLDYIVDKCFESLSQQMLQLLKRSKELPGFVIPASIEPALQCSDKNHLVRFLHASVQLVECRVASAIRLSEPAVIVNLDAPLTVMLHALLVDISEFANLLQQDDYKRYAIIDNPLGGQSQHAVKTHLEYLHQYASLYALFVLVMGHVKISDQKVILGTSYQVFMEAMPRCTWQQCLAYHAMSGIDFAGIEQQAEAGSSAGGGGGAADSAAADLPATQPLSGRQLESVIAGLAAELPVSLYAPDQCREFAQMLCYLAIHNFNTQSCALVILELLALSNHYKKSLLLGDGYQQPVHMPILQSHMGAYEAWCGLRAICWPAQLERDMCAVATILADVAPLCVRVRAMHVEQKLVLGSRVRGEVVAHMEALIENICTYEKHRVQANAFRKGLMLGKAMLLSEAEPALQVSLQPLKDALNSLKAEQRQGAVRERVRGGLSLAGVEEEGEDEVHTPGSPGADATL